jgi:putative peptidoglycan lipid II flippase
LLLAGLRKKGVYRAGPGWIALAARVAVPSAAMALALAAGQSLAGDWFAMSTLERVASLAALVGGGAAVYFLACYLVGLRPSELRMKSVA